MSSRRGSSPGSKSSGSEPAAQYAGMGKGAHLSPKRGSSLEFNDYRHYSPGDDFRYIDWGLYGRTDKLYIKLFKEEEDLLTYIFVDASASMGYPAADRKFDSAMLTALALAYVALRQRRPRDDPGARGKAARSHRRSSTDAIGSSSLRGAWANQARRAKRLRAGARARDCSRYGARARCSSFRIS